MAFDKVVEARLWGVTNQNSDTRITMGDSSGGTFTGQPNRLRGSLVWDDCFYVLQGVSVAGGATGGSYTITVETDAVSGYTGLPIARVSGIGRNSLATIVLTNLHNAPGSPLPTHLFIDQTATGGGIWFQLHAVAKQYRGVLATPGINTAERVIMGDLVRGASYSGGAFVSGKGFVADETVSLTGASASDRGMRRMRLYDSAFYWAVAGNSVSGSHDINIVGRAPVSGTTFIIATTTGTSAGTGLTAAGQKSAIASNLFGASPNPTAIIWDVIAAGGVSDARVVVLAKTGRGSKAKE
jgi:hypothetical protein